jgi:hypothetical protein
MPLNLAATQEVLYIYQYIFIYLCIYSSVHPSVRPFLHQSVPSTIRLSLPSVFYLFIYLTYKKHIPKFHLNVILLFSLPLWKLPSFYTKSMYAFLVSSILTCSDT